MNSPLAIIMISIAGAAIVAFAWISVRMHRRRGREWRRFARRHGLRFHAEPAGPLVIGRVESRELVLRPLDASSDTGELGMEEVRLSLRLLGDVPADLTVMNESGLVRRLDEMLDESKLIVGDPSFDEAVVCSGRDIERCRRYLTAERRDALLEFIDGTETATVGLEEGWLYWQDRSALADADVIDERLRSMLRIARRLDAAVASRRDHRLQSHGS